MEVSLCPLWKISVCGGRGQWKHCCHLPFCILAVMQAPPPPAPLHRRLPHSFLLSFLLLHEQHILVGSWTGNSSPIKCPFLCSLPGATGKECGVSQQPSVSAGKGIRLPRSLLQRERASRAGQDALYRTAVCLGTGSQGHRKGRGLAWLFAAGQEGPTSTCCSFPLHFASRRNGRQVWHQVPWPSRAQGRSGVCSPSTTSHGDVSDSVGSSDEVVGLGPK